MIDVLTHIANTVDLSPLPKVSADPGEIQKALTIIFTVTGSISLLIITIAGFRYVVARGNPQVISQSKSAIAYAAVGLLVSTSAVVIVSFVLGNA